jgi:fructosamine-3-kinase
VAPHVLPETLRDQIERDGRRIKGVTPVAGGMISTAARVDTNDGPVFAKWRSGPGGTEMFLAEAEGLRVLQATGVVRVPQVLAWGTSAAEGAAFLLLEHIAPEIPRDPIAFRDRFAAQLAALHRTQTTEAHEGYGFPASNFIGVLPQKNGPRRRRWALFYRECRLRPQIKIAREGGKMTPERERLLEKMIDRLDDLLAGMPEESSLLHGDLWSGNFLCAEGCEPVLIDPAVYYGPREMEMAFIELFGGFPEGFIAAYDAAYPLDAGYTYRRTLHQLYPLLVHLNHFGETYGPAVERACQAYVR